MTAEPTAASHPGTRSRGQHQRRKRIIQAAAALASRGGVEAMQMRTVAERAGVALGTLYRYFPSKMDLVVAVVGEELDLLEGSLERRPPRSATAPRRAVEVLMRATRGLMREPELADALIRSLLLSDVTTDFGDRMVGLLLRAAAGPDGDLPEGEGRDGGRNGGGGDDAGDRERRVLLRALSSMWVMEMIEMLRGHTTNEEIQARLEVAADRLLAGL
jgi:TetR/AcrR family transcriptional regulator, cholesterol catabolism regulator